MECFFPSFSRKWGWREVIFRRWKYPVHCAIFESSTFDVFMATEVLMKVHLELRIKSMKFRVD